MEKRFSIVKRNLRINYDDIRKNERMGKKSVLLLKNIGG